MSDHIFVKNRKTGVVFGRNKQLDAHPDCVPYWPENAEPPAPVAPDPVAEAPAPVAPRKRASSKASAAAAVAAAEDSAAEAVVVIETPAQE